MELVVDHHLRHDAVDLVLTHIKHLAQGFEGEAVILGGVSKQVCPQSLHLDLLHKNGLDLLARLLTRNEIPHLKASE